jgi:hypothetical protein
MQLLNLNPKGLVVQMKPRPITLLTTQLFRYKFDMYDDPIDICAKPPTPLTETAEPLLAFRKEHLVSPGDPRRYFTLGFDPRSHSCVLRHMNGIAVICLAPGHPVLKRGLRVKSIDFKVYI